MKMYKTRGIRFGIDGGIEEVEVDRITKSSVWVNGWRRAKNSEDGKYFDTWDEAYIYLLGAATNIWEYYQKMALQAQSDLDRVKNMKVPI